MSSCVRLFVTRVAKETASVENLPFKPFVGVKGVGGERVPIFQGSSWIFWEAKKIGLKKSYLRSILLEIFGL